jgi:hypothetical protein
LVLRQNPSVGAVNVTGERGKVLLTESHLVSKPPVSMADAARTESASPPTIQRIDGSWRRRLASLFQYRQKTVFYPANAGLAALLKPSC